MICEVSRRFPLSRPVQRAVLLSGDGARDGPTSHSCCGGALGRPGGGGGMVYSREARS